MPTPAPPAPTAPTSVREPAAPETALPDDYRITPGHERCLGMEPPSLEFGHIRFGPSRPMPEAESRRLVDARSKASDLARPRSERAEALLEVAELQWRIGNEREAADAALVALRYVDVDTANGQGLTRQACGIVSRFEVRPYRGVADYVTRDVVPPDLEARCGGPLGPGAAWPPSREPSADPGCIEVAECHRDGLTEPACTERVFAASCGQAPEQDTCGCYDLTRLFGAKPPVRAEQLAHLGTYAEPDRCALGVRNLEYLRSLEGTTLGATSSYARARAEAERCGADAERWARHLRIAVLEPHHPDPDHWLRMSPEAWLRLWQQDCPAR